MTDSRGDLSTTTFTVGELCQRVSDVLSTTFADEVWVQGAISGLSRSANGHVYFDLIDPTDQMGKTSGAVLPVALFASSRHLVNRILRRSGGIRMTDGIEIRIRGQVAYYPPQGRVQLVMSLIDPQFTLGQMAAARQQLIEKLSEERLLDRNPSLDFPVLPLRVALITSDQSAAYHDFVDELVASGYPFAITLIDSRVQGVDAVDSLAAAFAAVESDDLDVDVVVVARGGGARTDLSAFDHETVARAIATCSVPVVAGVGHETDRSVADEVAHQSTKTPTAAAGLLIDTVAMFDSRLADATERLNGITQVHLSRAQSRLIGCGSRLLSVARQTVDRHDRDLAHLSYRLRQSPERALERASSRLSLASTQLGALDPANALKRGWSITYVQTPDIDGSVDPNQDDASHRTLLRRADQVSLGSVLQTVTSDGTVESTVTNRIQTPADSEEST